MVRLIKAVLFLALLGFLGLAGYAYLGDMTPERSEVVEPVDLNADR